MPTYDLVSIGDYVRTPITGAVARVIQIGINGVITVDLLNGFSTSYGVEVLVRVDPPEPPPPPRLTAWDHLLED